MLIDRRSAPAGDVDGGIAAAIAKDGLAVVPRFAPRGLAEALAAEARRRDAAGEFRLAGVGRGAGRAMRADIRGDRTCWLDESELAPAERCLWGVLEALRLEVNRATALGLFSVEAHYAIYPPGGFYRRHRDRFRDHDARALSWILYLNEAWMQADGGALRIHLADGSARDVLPEAGTLACFLAERDHEVLPPQRERLSIAGWFRRRELR
ncbi:MAG TPA: 2OG-Fe(II) oxygenase [Casimicrobiaceae bacterium]|nr:2OG-Fe(II) oxygenase [Casimicrobiaceae bacterium]